MDAVAAQATAPASSTGAGTAAGVVEVTGG